MVRPMRLVLLAALPGLAAPAFTSALPQRTPATTVPSTRSELVDPGTARRILELLGRGSREEVRSRLGLDERWLEGILALRATRPGGRFGSFDELEEVWRLHASVFPTVYQVLGPPGMGLWETLPYRTPFSCAHSIQLHTGRVLLLPESNATSSVLWDPGDLVSPRFSTPPNQPGGSLFCSGHAQLSDGSILFAGGGGGGPGANSNRAYLFDPDSGENGLWAELPRMHFLRWYPTVVTLGSGHALIGGGSGIGLDPVARMEVYTEATREFTVVTGPIGDSNGADLRWSENYPGLHLLPSGHILFTRTGFGHQTDEGGTRAKYFTWEDPLLPLRGTWHDTAPMVFPDRTEGFSLQLPIRAGPRLASSGRVAVFGGGNPSLPTRRTVEIFGSEDPARAAWVRKADMNGARFHCMAVCLPDGTVLVAGGAEHDSNGTVGNKTTEIYDPATNAFTRQDDLQFARGYHSLCVLLPSAKVMISGGVSGLNETALEVFSPPYLFRGPRPAITAAPTEIVHAGAFEVETPDAPRIARAVLVRPMAFTHDTDSEQRVVELLFQRGEDRLVLKAPGGAPPFPGAPGGYYMLFLLDELGVPSEAVFVLLR